MRAEGGAAVAVRAEWVWIWRRSDRPRSASRRSVDRSTATVASSSAWSRSPCAACSSAASSRARRSHVAAKRSASENVDERGVDSGQDVLKAGGDGGRHAVATGVHEVPRLDESCSRAAGLVGGTNHGGRRRVVVATGGEDGGRGPGAETGDHRHVVGAVVGDDSGCLVGPPTVGQGDGEPRGGLAPEHPFASCLVDRRLAETLDRRRQVAVQVSANAIEQRPCDRAAGCRHRPPGCFRTARHYGTGRVLATARRIPRWPRPSRWRKQAAPRRRRARTPTALPRRRRRRCARRA